MLELFNIAFTGPREVIGRDEDRINHGLHNLELMAWEKPIVFHTGGAAGLDSIVFKRLAFSEAGASVLHVPFQYQYDALQAYTNCPADEIERYVATICPVCGPKKDYVRPTDNWLYQKRNEHMVDSSQMLVYYNPWKKGGTQNCIDYAKTTGIEMVNIFDL